jgi:hypothetical protein
MPDKHRVKLPGGGEGDATSILVNQAQEQWNTYLLEDGSVLKVKLVMTKIDRMDDLYDKEGNPVYAFQSTNVVSVTCPDNLKKKN